VLTEYYQLTIDRDNHPRVTETFPSAREAWTFVLSQYPTLTTFSAGLATGLRMADYPTRVEFDLDYSGGYITASVERVVPVS